ncbi:amino acid transporter [Exophiala dermatitidis]|uniref:AAT family amino acid transporter n=2 Tax=Exophiala dermatitidis TaxID=5970 RepID=H6C6W5_EXODN|nr:AAT family amino acid transporter [Exophiala dermatitidis NIH/UT8656]KAJ4526075.1 amino acid transporter [Exophiala dermatitidis]EHY59461.1 AAT family amino acid transporter [Exophiala dermatitidis NIH/UT8656]KAJ4526980.1 amino acid transporter [Exophiala dermatitidis]KAJ4532694.1 amino acid transporter [Exophiala dermatitidis]KAJ4546793.1 amino acid transporter [Exophiala dermatitidis]
MAHEEPRIEQDVEKISVIRVQDDGENVQEIWCHKEETPPRKQLRRGLKPRHLSMIALGGAIGSGLIIGSGQGLANYGPGSLLIGYAATGLLCFVVITALGEMATWLPLGTSFPGYASRFVDPALGFALGWSYAFKYFFAAANQLTSLALVIQFWVPRDHVNPGVFIAIFWLFVVIVNYLGVRVLGEVEFWLCTIKLLVLVGFIILGIVLAAGGGPNRHATGFEYWSNPGAFKPYIAEGATGKFLSVWAALNSGVFAYLGTEMVGVTVGEAQNPRRAIPRAIRMTFWRICIFYITTIFLVGLLVPYNSSYLSFAQKSGHGAAASPFVAAVKVAGIKALPGIINAAVMVFNLSAAVTDVYVASRTLYSLSAQHQAPAFLSSTNSRKIPFWAFTVAVSMTLLAFMNVSDESTRVFQYFVNLTTSFGLLTWVTILISHIHFVRARRAQEVTDSSLHFRAPFGLWGSVIALFFTILVLLTKNFSVFTHGSWGNFDYKNFLTGYLGVVIYIVLTLGWKIWNKTKYVRSSEADIWTGKAEVDQDEAEFLAQQAARTESHGKFHRLYRHTLGYLV